MTTHPATAFAHAPSTIRLGDLEVVRLGYGAMRLPGPDVWGEPEDPARAREVLRRVVALGMNLIDSAWFYGPHVANRLIAETLYPYPRDLVIASKLGGKRLPDKGWAPFSRPEQLREGCETDLRELRREVLDVVHLRYMGKASPTPFAESLDAMIALQKEGKIRHLALSNVGPAELAFALARTPIVSVQNLYSVSGGGGAMARMAHAEV
jgi:aryl-alcohol dehydrogenase-like predicted oxidoreductase